MCYDRGRYGRHRSYYDSRLDDSITNQVTETLKTDARSAYSEEPEKLKRVEEFVNDPKLQQARDYAFVKSYMHDVAVGNIMPEQAALLASTNVPSPRYLSPYYNNRGPQSESNRPNSSSIADFATRATEELLYNNPVRIDSTSSKEEMIEFADKRDNTLKSVSDYVTALRMEGQKKTFEIAERWSQKPDLTVEQACHGVAWEMQKNFGDTYGYQNGQYINTVDPGAEYAQLYDTNMVTKIKAGLMPSAKDLFD